MQYDEILILCMHTHNFLPSHIPITEFPWACIINC